MEFMSWSLNAPSNYYFDSYIKKVNGKWEYVDKDAINNWSDSSRNMFQMFEKYHEKIASFGLHEFGVNPDGSIYDYITERKINGERTGDKVLNSSKNEIIRWCKNSLQYLMDTYPDIRYAIQIMNFQGSGESKVDSFLDDKDKWDVCVQETKKIAELYIQEGFPITDIEVDFERASSRDGDAEKYADFLVKVKNEACIPLGLNMRVNMYAMTGDFNPHYYGWHDYKTLASRRDKNGNQAIDEFQLMTYDFSWAGSAPGPSTPQWWLKDVLEHVSKTLPPENTWVGNAGYGRRWGLDAGQRGSTVTYHQLLMWQNGMYVHNHEENSNEWYWHNQSWLPFAGFNDEESSYVITYLHLYDKFNTHFAEVKNGTINKTTYQDKEIITSYFKSQQPIFTGVKGVGHKPSLSGNVSSFYTGEGQTIPSKYLGKDYHFSGAYRANKAQYLYDKETEQCVPSPEDEGNDGEINYNINIDSNGKYKLVALVHFNTFTNNEINGSVNGTSFVAGGKNIDDWFPFYVDKYAWLEVGTFDFNTSNTIKVKPSSGYIWGFVICDDFDENFLGGQVEFDTYLMPYYKRGEDGEKEMANIPNEMIFTGEILRRPPRPAIIFEDVFEYLLDQEKVGYEVSDIPYYMKVQDHWDSGGNKEFYELENAYACTDSKGIQTIGFTDGSWKLQEDGTVRASVATGYSNQLVLYKKFGANIQVRADIKVSGAYPLAGIRLLASEEGNGNEGYLALLDYAQNKVVVAYEDSSGIKEIESAWMSDSLIDMKGKETTIYATVHNGKAYVQVGSTSYIKGANLSNLPSSGAYGVYIRNGSINVSMLNISTVDRYEPMEKMEIEIDGSIYQYGEVKRKDEDGKAIEYDKYGYLIYSGLNIEGLKEDAPDVPDDEGGSALLDFDEDYRNIPLAKHDSWEGRKQIRVRMVDAGIWFSQFFIGDAEGFSVAYNSDSIGFMDTLNMLFKYRCKGIAMWTIGQEDPLIFEYLPDS